MVPIVDKILNHCFPIELMFLLVLNQQW